MKILIAHSFYRQAGGEDQVVTMERDLLREHGHEVIEFFRNNSEIRDSIGRSARLATQATWSRESYHDLTRVLRLERPNVAHFHNTLPLLSPSVYYACRRENVPVIQTLHNYRIVCPAGLLFRNGKICELCVGRQVAIPSIIHACYRGSRGASAVVAGLTAIHKMAGTWTKGVNLYIAPSEFAKQELLLGGLPAHKIVVKPHFVACPEEILHQEKVGEYAVFVGRVSEEKGIRILLDAWARLTNSIALKIVGDGPLRSSLECTHSSNPRIEWLGQLDHSSAMAVIREARWLIFPSSCYETYGLTIAEAFAAGVPVVASRVGCIPELVEHGKTGLLFTVGDSKALATTLDGAWNEIESIKIMGRNARNTFTQRYSADSNYRKLMEIYETAISGN